MTADTTRTDLDALMSKIVDLMASGDGVEAGFTTTEFWLTVLAVALDVAAPYLGMTVSPDERMLGAGLLVGIYTGFRAWRKSNGPAKLWADVLKMLAELRGQSAPAVAPVPVAVAPVV
jgi:hypothetical protein